MNPRPCSECGQLVVWGKKPGGDVTPIEVDPRGSYILLKDKFLVTAPAKSWVALPQRDKREIPDDMVGYWREALDGPRYTIHSLACRQSAAMRLKQKDFVL